MDRKNYIVENYSIAHNITIKWIENFLPDCDFISNHSKVESIHAANSKYLNNAELSCYYKHQFALNLIAQTKDYGLIIEDDVEKPQFDFILTMNIFLDLMQKNKCDILFVGSFANHDLFYTEPKIVCNKKTKSRCAHAYVVSPDAAQKLVKGLKNIFLPLDWQLSYLIDSLSLKSCWSYPHIYQRTEKKLIRSLLR
jgi:GR25 family glycosyltransferase involved in LPS biosynthesis